MSEPAGPLHGLQVVEVALGVTQVGAGLAASLPGSLLRDLGARVVRIETPGRPALDAGVDFARAWNRGKEVLQPESDTAATTVADLARQA